MYDSDLPPAWLIVFVVLGAAVIGWALSTGFRSS